MSDADTAAGGLAFLRVDDVAGLPIVLGRRLDESDAAASERTAIAHDRGANTTVVRARDTAALEWLYDWLDTFDGDERVAQAAGDVADAVEAELDARLVTDGGEDVEQDVNQCEAPGCEGSYTSDWEATNTEANDA